MSDRFSEVSWNFDDIANAIDVQGFCPSDCNVDDVFCNIDEEHLREVMIEAGWNYIYAVVNSTLG